MDVSPDEGGTVELSNSAVKSYPTDITLDNGEVVNIEAIPSPGYSFEGWSGSISHSENPVVITMDCNKSLTAVFKKEELVLTINTKGKGSTNPEAGTLKYTEETTVTITAIPDDGWQFDGWTGDITGAESALVTITVDKSKDITANFSQTTPNQTIYYFIIAGIIACGIIVWLFIRARAGR